MISLESCDSMICMHYTCCGGEIMAQSVPDSAIIPFVWCLASQNLVGGMSGGNMLSVCCTALLLMAAAISTLPSVQGAKHCACFIVFDGSSLFSKPRRLQTHEQHLC
jgi:hypothetical protein